MDKLVNARNQINQIDKEMADLFEKRMKAVEAVVLHKIENNMQVFDATREEFVVSKNLEYIKNTKYKKYYEEFIKYVMDNSKKYQQDIIDKK